jgi:hypothetical protein
MTNYKIIKVERLKSLKIPEWGKTIIPAIYAKSYKLSSITYSLTNINRDNLDDNTQDTDNDRPKQQFRVNYNVKYKLKKRIKLFKNNDLVDEKIIIIPTTIYVSKELATKLTPITKEDTYQLFNKRYGKGELHVGNQYVTEGGSIYKCIIIDTDEQDTYSMNQYTLTNNDKPITIFKNYKCTGCKNKMYDPYLLECNHQMTCNICYNKSNTCSYCNQYQKIIFLPI